jgi:hypothetical protein
MMRAIRVILFSSVLLCLLASPSRGDELRPDYPVLQERHLSLSALVGESLVYDISFLWFEGVAEGRLSFAAGERPGTYRAVLEARTLGVAAWLTGDRVQRYVSLMEVGPDGRLRSLSFESHIIKGQGSERSDTTRLYTFDHSKHQVRFQRARKGKFYKEELLPMSRQAPPNDILTAFYNFRAGFFGPVKPGSRYTIPTFSRKGNEDIRIEILTDEERPADPFFPRGGLLGRVILDEEILDTSGGTVFVWFDDLGRPQRGIVENVIGLGNVRGKARE